MNALSGFGKLLARGLIMGAAAAVLAMASAGRTSAYTFHLLHAFCAKNADCRDGAAPSFPPVEGADGTLYGTTQVGGKFRGGVVYALTPNGAGYDYNVLYSFCRGQTTGNCADGNYPFGSLIVDANGNLFGTTQLGGANGGRGTVFELIYNSATSSWRHVILYNFCTRKDCLDGNGPWDKLTYAGESSGTAYNGRAPLYGTTSYGGNRYIFNAGVVFKLSYVKGQTGRSEKVLYAFCQQPNCTDGETPNGVTMDAYGNLFGTTEEGGANGDHGTVFRIAGGVETVLYNFCQQSGCADGYYPESGLTLTAKNALVGAVLSPNGGLVYVMLPNGTATQETVLYNFCSLPSCADGDFPVSGITIDAYGNLFGTTEEGGAFASSNCYGNGYGCGTVFRLNGTNETVLHSFCKAGLPDCADGAVPSFGSLLLDGSGNLFGAAQSGGKGHEGILFELTP